MSFKAAIYARKSPEEVRGTSRTGLTDKKKLYVVLKKTLVDNPFVVAAEVSGCEVISSFLNI